MMMMTTQAAVEPRTIARNFSSVASKPGAWMLSAVEGAGTWNVVREFMKQTI